MRNNMKYVALIVSGFIIGCGGSKGEMGPMGPTGLTGAAGVSTSSLSVTSNKTCNALDSGSGTSLFFTYQTLTYSNGEKFIMCAVEGSNAQYSASSYWRSNQNGATSSGCQIGADLDTASFGFWSFTTTSGVSKVKYTDSGSSKDQYTYTFLTADCTTN